MRDDEHRAVGPSRLHHKVRGRGDEHDTPEPASERPTTPATAARDRQLVAERPGELDVAGATGLDVEPHDHQREQAAVTIPTREGDHAPDEASDPDEDEQTRHRPPNAGAIGPAEHLHAQWSRGGSASATAPHAASASAATMRRPFIRRALSPNARIGKHALEEDERQGEHPARELPPEHDREQSDDRHRRARPAQKAGGRSVR